MQVLTRHNKIVAYSEAGFVSTAGGAICPTTGEVIHDVEIVTVDTLPTDIDAFEYCYIQGEFIKCNIKTPAILKGTTEPTSDLGVDGDIYIKYTVGE